MNFPRRRSVHSQRGRRRRARWVVAIVSLCAATALAAPTRAQERDAPLVFSADDVVYDRDSAIVIAEGRVEVARAERVLLADRVSYNTETGVVSASGNVSILEPNGDVVFASQVELRDDLREGFITGIGVLMADGSRLAANAARRTADQRTVMTRAVYSACPLFCPLDGHGSERAPLWQFKAARVIHDQKAKRIVYRDAVLEFGGFPVAYTPYFSHPDPTVDRKTGFLAPTYGSSDPLGAKVELPFFIAFAPHRDATITPLITSKEGAVLGAEYRERTGAGRFEVRGSITRADRRDESNVELPGTDTRGHVEALGRFDLDDTWRWGFDLARATDDTYLRRYDISPEDTLTTNVFAEGSRGRGYASVNTYFFQGLRAEDDPGETPFVVPLVDYEFLSEPGALGGRYGLDANLMILQRSQGANSRRLSLSGGWRLPYAGPAGDIYALDLSLRGDAYWTSEVDDPGDPTRPQRSGFTGRMVPQLTLGWRLPLVRSQGTVRQVIEPIAMVVLSPQGGNPDKIPNEDSQSFELDDTNLFDANRFPGLDRVEGGPRASYGVKLSAYGQNGGYTSAMLGQSVRLKQDANLGQNTGLEDELSDLVGRLSIVPSPLFDLTNRFRIEGESLTVRRNEIKLSAGPERWRLELGYVSLDRLLTVDELTSREEINLRGRVQLSTFWSATANGRRDLEADGGRMLDAGFGVAYEDCCFIFGSQIRRDFTSDRDVRPSTSLVVQIKLKNIG